VSEVTQILGQIEDGDGQAAEKLLPLVYDELRKLAAAKMAKEDPGQTLQATALVHEAYIRLVDVEKAQHWDSRGHFFSAAAEAMRSLTSKHPEKAELVKLRYFAGLTHREAASALGIPIATADRHWRYARAWLAREMRRGSGAGGRQEIS
jgi:DNA-directed RNA polymerase specialized sigma24 family protein